MDMKATSGVCLPSRPTHGLVTSSAVELHALPALLRQHGHPGVLCMPAMTQHLQPIAPANYPCVNLVEHWRKPMECKHHPNGNTRLFIFFLCSFSWGANLVPTVYSMAKCRRFPCRKNMAMCISTAYTLVLIMYTLNDMATFETGDVLFSKLWFVLTTVTAKQRETTAHVCSHKGRFDPHRLTRPAWLQCVRRVGQSTWYAGATDIHKTHAARVSKHPKQHEFWYVHGNGSKCWSNYVRQQRLRHKVPWAPTRALTSNKGTNALHICWAYASDSLPKSSYSKEKMSMWVLASYY